MKIAVIVGRFQSHKLTDGHKELIRYATSQCDKLIIFVGVYPLKPNFKNPLPYKSREFMIYEFIPSYLLSSPPLAIVAPIVDVFNIPLWSKNLDEKIKELVSETDEVTLYGSRDSFIFNYTGKYQTKEVKASGDSSASQLREVIKRMDVTGTSEDFRKGVIWALGNDGA